ncbi:MULTISPECIES: hypothetical protein [Chryseobacterium]|uniref:Uncharacterized protein n=2 Tax=Chryseobacterium TaxID=59732 RepID=A0AAD0YIY7_CHRNA|nr:MULTISPECIES: hypothetical protein [Chryseobacterium]AZA89849.1 hypothetical protein EG343_04010 [Chryseobacterium nakagawai]SMP12517.1 hypothetical protein SAMN06264346_102458 [Chryseobacterium profundimaris]VEH21255.1 Uncharacterised protein [Chryseobacterium nakagawai]
MYEDPSLFWKNFRLGTELHVAGSMIYNGLYSFDQIEYFRYEHEIFEFLYNISIGIERLQKITIILSEHTEKVNQSDFEKTLITHNHMDLLNRIKQKHTLNFGKQHVKFLQLLTDFYRTTRYSRYNLQSVYEPNQDLFRFIAFLKSELKVTEQHGIKPMVENSISVKRFIGKLLKKICSVLYEIIQNESRNRNINTYDILTFSKPYKIFIEQEFTFEKEKHLQRELLILLLSGKMNDGMTNFVKNIEPLGFGNYTSNEYIRYMLDIRNNPEIIDEMLTILEDEPMKKDRLEKVRIIGDKNIYFQDDDD